MATRGLLIFPSEQQSPHGPKIVFQVRIHDPLVSGLHFAPEDSGSRYNGSGIEDLRDCSDVVKALQETTMFRVYARDAAAKKRSNNSWKGSDMTPTIDDAARIIHLNGGRIIGKTRFQKSSYFLEAMRIGFGFDFDYHHFGPYSEELANITDDARALGVIDVDWKVSQEGAKYAVFSTRGNESQTNKELDEVRRAALSVLRKYSAVELELAATAHYLEKSGYKGHAWEETRRRKAMKVSEERINRARELLAELYA